MVTSQYVSAPASQTRMRTRAYDWKEKNQGVYDRVTYFGVMSSFSAISMSFASSSIVFCGSLSAHSLVTMTCASHDVRNDWKKRSVLSPDASRAEDSGRPGSDPTSTRVPSSLMAWKRTSLLVTVEKPTAAAAPERATEG